MREVAVPDDVPPNASSARPANIIRTPAMCANKTNERIMMGPLLPPVNAAIGRQLSQERAVSCRKTAVRSGV
jgi:hypothetical protein